MHLCWWCFGRLIWDEDVDACEHLCDDVDGICTLLHCSRCGAVVTYAPPRWED